ncbi:Hypothetical predicted protein [Podarcis lilfordi]|uniref:Uncharacterized protein n=1 Tax=Podarcis lilfordi TaxID=74358 RepID=A0AA35JVW1_9SAUR|nr:Hypothetical predicted protein [Podarcis lilfordi]
MYSEALLCALCKTNALLEQLTEKTDLMTNAVRIFEQAVGNYMEPTQELNQECALTEQMREEDVAESWAPEMEGAAAQQEHELLDLTNELGKSQIRKDKVWTGLEMGGWIDPPMQGCLDFPSLAMGRGMFGAVGALNFGGILKHVFKYHMEFSLDYGKGADLLKRVKNITKLEFPRVKGEYEEELRKGHGRDLRASDIRLPG